MGKVLISFLGTGPYSKVDGTSHRVYEKAKYKFPDGKVIESSFVADALARYYGIDKIILIGTVRSMWENVYEAFCERNGVQLDEEYYVELGDSCHNAGHDSDFSSIHLGKLGETMGNGSSCVLVKYGLTRQEQETNAEIILGIEKLICKNDELYVDITHSFRSLPLYMLNLLMYLKNVCGKSISIKQIMYGMLEVRREMPDGCTPIVDLSSILDVSDWITGAYMFKNFANGYLISDLLQREGQKSASVRINKFTELMGLNHLDGIKNQVQEISSIKNPDNYGPMSRVVVPQVINDFIGSFPKDTPSSSSRHAQSSFQYSLACWHYRHKNYSSAYLAVVESIVSYVCESYAGFDPLDYDSREYAKEFLRKRSGCDNIPEFRDLCNSYKILNSNRICIAHTKGTSINSADMVSVLEEHIIKLSEVLGHGN